MGEIRLTLAIGESFLRSVNSQISGPAYAKTILLKMAQAFGNYIRIPTAKADHSEWKYAPTSAGRLALLGIEEKVELGSDLSEDTADLLWLGAKIPIGTNALARMEASALGVNASVQGIVAAQLAKTLQGAESVLACGQAGRYLDDADDLKTLTTDGDFVTKGLLFDADIQTISGGIGADNNTSAFGDYLATCATYVAQAEDQGIDVANTAVIMDSGTYQKMVTSLSTNVYEFPQIRAAYPTWSFLSTPNFLATNLTGNHYMWFISPKQTSGEATFKVVESIPGSARPLNGGNPDSNDQVNILVEWMGGVIVKNGYGIAKTGALTL